MEIKRGLAMAPFLRLFQLEISAFHGMKPFPTIPTWLFQMAYFT
jgi:hypothetical protein